MFNFSNLLNTGTTGTKLLLLGFKSIEPFYIHKSKLRSELTVTPYVKSLCRKPLQLISEFDHWLKASAPWCGISWKMVINVNWMPLSPPFNNHLKNYILNFFHHFAKRNLLRFLIFNFFGATMCCFEIKVEKNENWFFCTTKWILIYLVFKQIYSNAENANNEQF